MNKKVKILLVDDERHISAMTKDYLISKEYEVTLHHNGENGLMAVQNDTFDICILDIKMPIMNGFVLGQKIKDMEPEMPIIFLTGKTEAADRVKGLRFGANDYITKPYSLEELDLRIQNVFRHTSVSGKQAQSIFTFATFKYNSNTRELISETSNRKLTSIESRLLLIFCTDENGQLNRNQALRNIWNDEHGLHGRSLNVYVSKLRGYLKADPNIDIMNIHGVGYRMVVRE